MTKLSPLGIYINSAIFIFWIPPTPEFLAQPSTSMPPSEEPDPSITRITAATQETSESSEQDGRPQSELQYRESDTEASPAGGWSPQSECLVGTHRLD